MMASLVIRRALLRSTTTAASQGLRFLCSSPNPPPPNPPSRSEIVFRKLVCDTSSTIIISVSMETTTVGVGASGGLESKSGLGSAPVGLGSAPVGLESAPVGSASSPAASAGASGGLGSAPVGSASSPAASAGASGGLGSAPVGSASSPAASAGASGGFGSAPVGSAPIGSASRAKASSDDSVSGLKAVFDVAMDNWVITKIGEIISEVVNTVSGQLVTVFMLLGSFLSWVDLEKFLSRWKTNKDSPPEPTESPF